MLFHGIIKRALIICLGLVVTGAAAASCSSPCGAQGQSCCGDSCNAGLSCYGASDGTCVQAGSGTFSPPESLTSDAGDDSASTMTEDGGPDAADASDATATEDAAESDAPGSVADSGDDAGG
jgi:hypothetical protein